MVFRGEGLAPEVSDSDPQQIAVTPETAAALSPEANAMTSIANQFIAQARRTLAEYHPANMILLRGFSKRPHFPSMGEI